MKTNYTILEDGTIMSEINGVTSFIPTDPANSDYQRYLRWLKNPDADESGTL